MTRLLALAGALTLSALAVPALAADEPAPVLRHGACAAPAGAVVLTPTSADLREVDTPVGAGNDLLLDRATEVGTFVLDLEGLPKTQRGSLTFTLEWDNPLSDYDLITNGSNDLATDNPETKSVSVNHCGRVDVGVDVFLGVPVDVITLTTQAG